MRQFPARPVEPVRGFVFAAREREAERRFAARRRDLGAGAGLDQRVQQRHRDRDVELDREMQRRAAERIARVRIGAAREQRVRDRDVAERDGRVQRGTFRRASCRTSRRRVRRDPSRARARARRFRRAARSASKRATMPAPPIGVAACGEIGERGVARRQQIEQRVDERAAVAERRVAAEPVVEQPVARFARWQLGEREIEIGERRRGHSRTTCANSATTFQWPKRSASSR